MLCRLLSRLLRIDWHTPLTSASRGSGPMLDRLLEQRAHDAGRHHAEADVRPLRMSDALGPRSIP